MYLVTTMYKETLVWQFIQKVVRVCVC